jgi:hypothetical protein
MYDLHKILEKENSVTHENALHNFCCVFFEFVFCWSTKRGESNDILLLHGKQRKNIKGGLTM